MTDLRWYDFRKYDLSKASEVLRTDDVLDSVVEKFMTLTCGQFLNFKKAHDYYSRAMKVWFFVKGSLEYEDFIEYLVVMHSLLHDTKIMHRGLSPYYPVKAVARIDDLLSFKGVFPDEVYYIIGTEGGFEEELKINKWLQNHNGESVLKPLLPFITGWLEVFVEWDFHPEYTPQQRLLRLIAPKHAIADPTFDDDRDLCQLITDILDKGCAYGVN